jgi:alpha-glucosidase
MAEWWRRGVVYQIYPRSFSDGNGDGVGDLAGIRARLDHLQWLGVDAIWLSPIFRSPMADFGYDVSDYCDVDPLFGTLADADALIADLHARGMKLLLDWVPNHTSDRHPWFVASRASRTSPKRDWYVWRDPAPDGGPPNDWRRCFGHDQPAWTFDERTGQYFLHGFLPEQPDLNWANPEVEAAMHGVLAFWLDRGVDGFRIDVVPCLGKDPTFPNERPEWRGVPHAPTHHDPERTQPILRRLRRFVDRWPDRVLVGEVFLLFHHDVASYYGEQGDLLQLNFDLPHVLHVPWDAAAWRARTEEVMRALGPIRAWPTLVLSNHDTPRHRTRLGSEARARAAALLLLALPGTPFLYAGEELGLEDAVVPPDRVVDPGGRDGCRAPIPWDRSPSRGWGPHPWLPFPADADRRNVAALRADPGSILHLYRRLLALRRATPALSHGDYAALDAPDGVFAWRREYRGARCLAAVNFRDAPAAWSARGTVALSTDGGGEGARFSGSLAPAQGIVLVDA